MTEATDPVDDILAWLEALVAIPTTYPPGDTSAVAAYLAGELSAMGYDTRVHRCEAGQDNVVARLGRGSPSLVFNVHVDTVDAGDTALWHTPPFEATRMGDAVFGLGVANCKGSGAVQLWLAREIARRGGPARGEVVFTFVADEESLGERGTKFLADTGVIAPDMLLLGAPTDNTVTNEERGVLWVEVTTQGRAAHAGQPEDGDNAILRMLRVLDHLVAELNPRLLARSTGSLKSTMNLGLIEGGRNNNVVPSHCSARIDRRLLPEETVDSAFAEMQSIVLGAGEPDNSVDLRFLLGTNGFRSAIDGPMIAALRESIEAVSGQPAAFSSGIGVSDGRHFTGREIEIVNFGPGVGSEGHASNESVTLDSLRQSARVLEATVGRVLGYAEG
ncbi:MAG: ArgE/DapE family deacylase [Halieaceae bacterium]|jgi:acetylornithine deacetylase/succinyl-diaminopimelate desuccinylase family protein|nr:ArgE/DapE family deacylase [Halieaceae bacterium]